MEYITEDNDSIYITYGPEYQRKITELYQGTTLVKKKIYAGGLYEMEEDNGGNIRHLYYVPGISGEAAIFVKENTAPGELFYIHKDHLDSYQTITDENGSVVDTLSFDPWGRRRNANDWTYTSIPATYMFDRGFTGHEHLDVFDLINMNGRVFDPATSQFLSPDHFVQNNSLSQNYNRYIYALNNPLKYTDPSGWNYRDVVARGGGTLFYNLGDYCTYLRNMSSGQNNINYDMVYNAGDYPDVYVSGVGYCTSDQYKDLQWQALTSGYGNNDAGIRRLIWEQENGESAVCKKLIPVRGYSKVKANQPAGFLRNYKRADLGAKNPIDQIIATLYYLYEGPNRIGRTSEEIFDFSNARRYIKKIPGNNYQTGDYERTINGIQFFFYESPPGYKIIFAGMKLYRLNGNPLDIDFHKDNLIKSNFPTKYPSGNHIPGVPYQIYLEGWMVNSNGSYEQSHDFGRIKFNDWDQFVDFCNQIIDYSY